MGDYGVALTGAAGAVTVWVTAGDVTVMVTVGVGPGNGAVTVGPGTVTAGPGTVVVAVAVVVVLAVAVWVTGRDDPDRRDDPGGERGLLPGRDDHSCNLCLGGRVVAEHVTDRVLDGSVVVHPDPAASGHQGYDYYGGNGQPAPGVLGWRRSPAGAGRLCYR